MDFRGKSIDPIRLWQEYCEIVEDDGPFLPLTYCPNPDHDNTRSPAFQVNIEQPTVHCFGHCGISGSYEHAICVIHDLYGKHKSKREAYREARKIIRGHARIAGVDAPSRRRKGKQLPSPEAQAKAQGYDDLSRYSYLPPRAVEYLDSRGISSSVISRFEVGWDMDELRIVVPVKDERKRVCGLIRRATKPNDHPKYLYTEGFDRNSLLFGACFLDLGLVRSDGLVLVEGSFDTMHMHSLGVTNTVGTLGSFLSRRHTEIISRLNPPRVFLMFDKDPAGIGAILSARQRLVKFPLFVCRYPKGKADPAELTRKEAHRSLEKAVPMLQFVRILPDALTRREAQQVG